VAGDPAGTGGPVGVIRTFDPLEGLIRQAVRGERTAAEALVRAVSPRLWRVAWRLMGGNSADAEDVVQEALVQLWRKLPDWRLGEARIETWLHTVVTSRCLDRLRRTGRTVSEDEAPELEDPSPAPDAGLLAADTAAAVDAALAALPDRQRAALVLVHYEELSGAEASAALGISVEALESLLARARRTLRQRLAPLNPVPLNPTLAAAAPTSLATAGGAAA
jgi:RNA polymerase sigma-70 factor, ECF subfamily